MGYGGALIWTGLARNLKKAYPEKKLIFLYRGTPKEILLNKPISDHVIYQNNDDIFLISSKLKWFFVKKRFRTDEIITVDMDDPNCRYWGKQTRDKIEFKTKKHAIEIACEAYGLKNIELKPKIVLSKEEISQIDRLLQENNLEKDKFICIEPHANIAYTPNKSWFWDRWQELTDKINQYIQQNNLDCKIVQIGAPTKEILNGVVDLTGKTSFRDTARILEQSKVFICYVGGLVHLAKAMGKINIVLVSAWEPKELASYPDDVNFYSDMECKNCGLIVPCPRDRQCMKNISVEEVFGESKKFLIRSDNQ
jgi:ADP-heptose:LPS heptosyltransferase